MTTMVDTLPTNERQVRPLAALEPEVQREVWAEVVKESAGVQPTAVQVKAKVEEVVARKNPAQFNKTNDNIGWAQWSWNPVTGCKHGCPYCYARDIAMRFDGHFNPTFRDDRLDAPKNTKPIVNTPSGGRVFVCSMADLFGTWVPNEWIGATVYMPCQVYR